MFIEQLTYEDYEKIAQLVANNASVPMFCKKPVPNIKEYARGNGEVEIIFEVLGNREDIYGKRKEGFDPIYFCTKKIVFTDYSFREATINSKTYETYSSYGFVSLPESVPYKEGKESSIDFFGFMLEKFEKQGYKKDFVEYYTKRMEEKTQKEFA